MNKEHFFNTRLLLTFFKLNSQQVNAIIGVEESAPQVSAPEMGFDPLVRVDQPTAHICKFASTMRDHWPLFATRYDFSSVDMQKLKKEGDEIPIILCSDISGTVYLSMVAPYAVRVVEETAPGVLRQVSTLSVALMDWAKVGFKLASPIELDARIAICQKCEQWEPKGWAGLGKCKKCGCSGVKLKLASEKCPLGKWYAINNS